MTRHSAPLKFPRGPGRCFRQRRRVRARPRGKRGLMYEAHFGLRSRPFRSTPDCGRYYPATGHEHALAALEQAVADGDGLALLTGGPGLGKTLLCHCLLHRAGEVPSAFLTNTHLPDRHALLQAILYELSVPYQGMSEQECRL